MLSDVVAASAAPPPVTVHTGTFPVTKIAELAVMVIVSDRSCAPAIPVLRTPSEDGVKMNLCLMGAMSSVSWLYDVAEPQTTGVAARVVYVATPDVVVSCVVTIVNVIAGVVGFAAIAPTPPFVHVKVCAPAAICAVTVSVRVLPAPPLVKAVTVPPLLPVHAGILLSTNTASAEVVVIVIVSAMSAAPVPVGLSTSL